MNRNIRLQIKADEIAGTISPLLFGQFIENMYDCIDPGLHAQLLVSRGFEYPDSNDDGVSEPWFPEGEGEFALDFSRILAPSYSQRIRCLGEEKPCGIAQSGLALYNGEDYTGYFWLYVEQAVPVRVTVLSEQGAEIFAETYTPEEKAWKRYEFHLHSACDQKVSLHFSVCQAGEIWLDQTSLMPDGAVGHVWPDVMRRIKSLRPSIMRFPGGCFADCYHWRDGVGERDLRPARPNAHWGGTEENGFGTDEFISFCREVNCEPMICVNFGSGTPEEAANWVEYCNGSTDSRYGALRAANGHPEPYGVKYWDIGNEAFADWEIGHCNAEEYCRRFMIFSNAMRKVDPTIRLIACGGDGNSSDQEWNTYLCQGLGQAADYLGIHNYTPLTGAKYPDAREQYYAVVGAPIQYEERMRETERVLRGNSESMRLAVTEWNCNYQDGTYQEQTMEAAVCNGGMLNSFIRLGDMLALTMISDLVNGWPGGIIRSARGKCFGTPSYHVLALYAQAEPTELLACEYHSPTYSAKAVGNLKEMEEIPLIDMVTCRTKDDRLCLFVINRDLENTYTIQLPEGFFASSISTVSAEHFNARNTQNEEKIVPNSIGGEFAEFPVPPCSVNRVYLM